jgi:uncharacterized radical SAM superfamily protein
MNKTQISELLKKSRNISWQKFGRKIDFYLPGMITLNKERGKYPAVSITGNQCELNCDHCGSGLLESMVPSLTPEDLVERCIRLEKAGNVGCLISGGCSKDGCLPWEYFIEALSEIKKRTSLFISVHSGRIDFATAVKLKEAGVDQTLIDVVGDDETLRTVYHLDTGVESIRHSLSALKHAQIPVVPHIVAGLHYGKIRGELNALKILSEFNPEKLVIVVLMPLGGTPMQGVSPPGPYEVAEILARARIELPDTLISLGCARPRGKISEEMELLAIDSGVNRMAIWSEEALLRAKDYGLEIQFHKTCCSV